VPFNPLPPSDAVRQHKKNNISEDLFSSVLSQFKKYLSSGNLKFNYFRIFQSLKLRIFVGKIISIYLKLNFTPNTLGCFGLNTHGDHCKDSTNSKFPRVSTFLTAFWAAFDSAKVRNQKYNG